MEPQPSPINSASGKAIWPTVLESLAAGDHPTTEEEQRLLAAIFTARNAAGIAKYGVPLQVHNGRSALLDLLQEAVDAVAYSRQVYERSHDLDDLELHRTAVDFTILVVRRLLREEEAW